MAEMGVLFENGQSLALVPEFLKKVHDFAL